MKAKSSFNKILSKQSLLAITNIGLMEGCMQTGESNENAGISSYEGSSIRVKKENMFLIIMQMEQEVILKLKMVII